VQQYIPEIQKRKIVVLGAPLSRIVATVHKENMKSKKILEKIGMLYQCMVEKPNRRARLFYAMDLAS